LVVIKRVHRKLCMDCTSRIRRAGCAVGHTHERDKNFIHNFSL